MYQKEYHIFFVGIGGIGMSGIAELLLKLKYNVSGSDIKMSPITRRLESLGGKIYQGHSQENIKGADVIVVSSAIKKDNPEVKAARKESIPVIPRAEMLAELMRLKYSIAVSGTHGKTTTTSIVASVLEKGKLDPTVVIGGVLKSIGTNAWHGLGDFIVAEADESDGSFLKFSPSIAIVTNIDSDHLDFYKGIDEIKQTFLQFIKRVPFYGLAILCLDSEAVQDLIPEINCRFSTYGISSQADFQARNIEFNGPKSRFDVYRKGEKLGKINLNLPGVHNILNCLASITLGIELEIPFETIKCALENLEGVQRRIEKKGEVDGILVIDDYGHHPTEIKATLTAIKESWPEKRLVVVFQPHRHTRTHALLSDFTRSFYDSDALIVLPIYAAGENPIENVTAELLCEKITAHGHKDAIFIEKTNDVIKHLKTYLKEGDILLTLGAGNVYRLGEEYLEEVKN